MPMKEGRQSSTRKARRRVDRSKKSKSTRRTSNSAAGGGRRRRSASKSRNRRRSTGQKRRTGRRHPRRRRDPVEWEKVMANRRAPRDKRVKKYKEMPIHVVDEHDGSMVCILRAIEQGYIPGRRVKLLHFDSHPDLGCPEKTWKYVDSVYERDYSIHDLYKVTDIATWITPMALMGHIDFVCWANAYWCDQFPVGTWDLLVGKCKKTGRIKIGTKGDKHYDCLEYWESDDAVCKEKDFEYCREWTLMVVRYGKNLRLSPAQFDRLTKEFSEGPWVLDIDEDFLSCNNPYLDKFRDLFGERAHKLLSKIYNINPQETEVEDELHDCFKNEGYKKSWARFSKGKLVRNMKKGMQESGKTQALKSFHKFLNKHWPKEHGMDMKDMESSSESSTESSEADEWEIANFFSLDDVHSCGQLSILPHHISSAREIKGLMNEVDMLLEMLPTPKIVTVATSRLDRYLPDSQAALIHGFLESVLTSRYSTETVMRLDRPHLSVDNRVDTKANYKRGHPASRFVTDILAPEK